MPETQSKAQGNTDSFPFNTALVLKFTDVTLSGTTQDNTVIAARLWLPTAVKIYRVIAGLSGSLAGTISLNIVRGTAARVANSGATKYLALPIPDTDYANQPVAPNTQAYPPAYPTAGQSLFLNDQVLTIAEDPATVLTPAGNAASTPDGAGAYAFNTPGKAYDSIWGPGGAEITLRLPCAGATAVASVSLLCKAYDPTFAKPILTGFNPAVDIP